MAFRRSPVRSRSGPPSLVSARSGCPGLSSTRLTGRSTSPGAPVRSTKTLRPKLFGRLRPAVAQVNHLEGQPGAPTRGSGGTSGRRRSIAAANAHFRLPDSLRPDRRTSPTPRPTNAPRPAPPAVKTANDPPDTSQLLAHIARGATVKATAPRTVPRITARRSRGLWAP
jgi:hypothetical protein